MAIAISYIRSIVVLRSAACINCRACERQCANEVHFWDAENNRMQADESKCVLPPLRGAVPDPCP